MEILSLIYLAVAWSMWCFLHSFLISISVTTYFERLLGNRFRWYRLLYNLWSLVSILPVLVLRHSCGGTPVVNWPTALQPIRFGMIALAVLYIIGGMRNYPASEFLGLAQLRESGVSPPASAFESRGIHCWVRHPWYAAVLLLLWVQDLSAANLTTAVVLSIYILVGTRLEEGKLAWEFGESYQRYKETTPAFFPIRKLLRRT